jgi:hypothetical protein
VEDSDLIQFGIKKEKAAGSDQINEVKSSSAENDNELKENGEAETEGEPEEPIVTERELEINDDAKSLRLEDELEEPVVTERELEISDGAKVIGPIWSSSKTLDVAVVIVVSVMLIAVFLLPSETCTEFLRRIVPITDANMVQFDQSLESVSNSASEAVEAIQNCVVDNVMIVPTFLQEKVCDIVGNCFA